MPKYKIEIKGDGGEFVAGFVSQESYDYFQENDLDINDYAEDRDNELEVPEESQPFDPGYWSDCDNISHKYGCEVFDESRVIVENEDGEEVFEASVTDGAVFCQQDDDEVQVDIDDPCDELMGKPVYSCRTVERGLFFQGTLEIEEPFNPDHLYLKYGRFDDDWELITKVLYGPRDADYPDHPDEAKVITIDNDGGGDTITKDRTHSLRIAGERFM